MKLTYEVTEKGYIIKDNDVPWIIQEGYIPYPGKDFNESAENHMAQIIKDNAEQPQQAKTNFKFWK